MNQIIAALLLFGLVTAVIVPIIIGSWEEITSNSVSIAEFMEIQQTQNGQILHLISMKQEPGSLSLDLMNVGIYEIGVDVVLIDGIAASYTLTDQSLNPIDVISLNKIVLLDVTGSGSTVQIISESGKLFEFVL
ncbi:hypothetical protein [Nitrosopumilus ureiphilus]|uniref:Uncharacterized protein n=1 Tax=Nitrosopumilus ureiphilus TaxID=1470067 RepID=A0A7D5M5L0_9ARCH|nr:hypothetical protein [Nitrosopumilus ureiphilus]QLH07093.1 hypothetical protein C5F50_08430 [Nitrosopumilus ureiphilus]